MHSRLFRLAKILVAAWLQLLYAAQSLSVVDHGASRGTRPPFQEQNRHQRGYRIPMRQQRRQPWRIHPQSRRSPVRGTRQDIALSRRLAGCGPASATAIAVSSTGNHGDEVSSSDPSSDPSSSPSPSLSSSPPPRSLNELLDELTERGVVFSPTASRAELEDLLDSKIEEPAAAAAERIPTTSREGIPPTGEDPLPAASSMPSPQRPRPEQRSRQIEDRMRRRMARRSSGTRMERSNGKRIEEEEEEEETKDDPSRRRRREGPRRDRRPGIGVDGDIAGDANPVDGRTDAARRAFDDGASLRRRRRRDRAEDSPPSLRKSVNEMADIGARAGRIARRKTGRLWRDLVDSTYEELDEDVYYADSGKSDASSPRSRRPRRRSGFSWQEPPRPEEDDDSRRRQRRRGSEWMDERRAETVTGFDFRTESDNYSDTREEESFRRRKRQQRRESRGEKRQDPYDNRRVKNPSPSSKSTMDSSATTAFADDAKSGSKWGKLPIDQILATLDERDVVYPPTASRSELEELLLDSISDNDVVAVKKAKQDIEVIEVESISPEDWEKQQEEKRQQKQKEQERQEEIKQKRQQRTKNQSNSGETSKSHLDATKGGTTTTTTRSTATGSSPFSRRSIHNNNRPSGFSATTAKAYGAGSSRRQRWRRKLRTAAGAATSSFSSRPPPRPRQASDNRSASSSFGAKTSGTPFRAPSGERRNSGTENSVPGSQTRRPIYSPYGRRDKSKSATPQSPGSSGRNRKENDFDVAEDDFDRLYNVVEDDLGRFGDFLADSVDNIFWGTVEEDDKVREDDNDRPPHTPPPSGGTRKRNSSTGYRTGKRHWKDRAEERVDKVLGVHKVGGKTYDRWAKKKSSEAAEDRDGGYDAFSYVKGRKRSRRPRRRSGSSKAFWQGEDSVLSGLFGYDDPLSPRRNVDDLREVFRSSNTLTVLIRNLLEASARIVGSVCAWASVRDTIPRPLVFLGGVGAGCLSRPGNRIKSAALAILSFRVVGEWLRGVSDGDDEYDYDHDHEDPPDDYGIE